MGRPKKKASEKRSVRLVLRLTPAEHRALAKEAARTKLPLATFSRLMLLK